MRRGIAVALAFAATGGVFHSVHAQAFEPFYLALPNERMLVLARVDGTKIEPVSFSSESDQPAAVKRLNALGAQLKPHTWHGAMAERGTAAFTVDGTPEVTHEASAGGTTTNLRLGDVPHEYVPFVAASTKVQRVQPGDSFDWSKTDALLKRLQTPRSLSVTVGALERRVYDVRVQQRDGRHTSARWTLLDSDLKYLPCRGDCRGGDIQERMWLAEPPWVVWLRSTDPKDDRLFGVAPWGDVVDRFADYVDTEVYGWTNGYTVLVVKPGVGVWVRHITTYEGGC